jgi:hypothetical protein
MTRIASPVHVMAQKKVKMLLMERRLLAASACATSATSSNVRELNSVL